ncbi:MAG TPA: hypothetical protein VGN32_18125 [Ktedonobacterales bacterium]|nr:hypothetical protein [Ktedonobacterales bacterium]
MDPTHPLPPASPASGPDQPIERVQIGARMEKRMVKVLKALAEYHDVSLGDLLEGIVLHAFESKVPFNATTLERITLLKQVYGLDYGASASHQFTEPHATAPDPATSGRG